MRMMAKKVIEGIEVVGWNTGRVYSKEGQRIIATKSGKGIVFYDIDRMVDGFIPCELDRGAIMSGYDNHKYTWEMDARNDMAFIKRRNVQDQLFSA